MTGQTKEAVLRDGFSAPTRAVHSATVALLIGSYTTTWAISAATTREAAQELVIFHHSLGVLVLCLTAARLVIRLRSRIPSLAGDVPVPQRVAAKLAAIGLYLLLILQPLLGLLGSVVIPSVFPADRKLSRTVFEAHGPVALVLLGLIGIHVPAALYHHLVRRDAVLAGMLPGLHGGRRPEQIKGGRRRAGRSWP